MDAVNRYSQLDYRVAPTLFLEFHGTPAAVEQQVALVREILAGAGGDDFRWASEAPQRDRLWQARYDAYYAALALRPGSLGYVTDVCVPISQLAECIRRTRRELESTNIPAPLFGHVGDGNFHVVFLVQPDDAAELAEVSAINRRIVAHALELGGTSTGEHGIDLGKIDILEQQYGPAVDAMRAIKQALDPHNLMNPGKVLRMGISAT
jgi:D-lactate dehydrogenase (cytochrome)